MSIWITKNEDSLIDKSFENFDKINIGDSIYIYWDESALGGFIFKYKLLRTDTNFIIETDFQNKHIDLPYKIFYKTKAPKKIIQLTKNELDFILSKSSNIENANKDKSNDKFISFLRYRKIDTDTINLNNVDKNIVFIIGQPNTGKSYKFEESQIFNGEDSNKYTYLKVPVSGGVGNEYKGLQNTDLAITYDPIKKELKFGEFLQSLMSAIVNPSVPHVVFLDDFHNQDISSLLSEYTPLFKAQQKRKITQPLKTNDVYKEYFSDVDEFITIWNNFITTHCSNIPIVPLTNRISGQSLNLVYPSNFYLLGAANFNENSLNIFADWEDRAKIIYKNPIDTFNPTLNSEDSKSKFLECCKTLNSNLRDILEAKNIFDYDRYCFGMWKVFNSEGKLISKIEEQKQIIEFFFGMIKNSLKFNNKNSYINDIGWQLIVKMQKNTWFQKHIEKITDFETVNYQILHKYNIYEDDI